MWNIQGRDFVEEIRNDSNWNYRFTLIPNDIQQILSKEIEPILTN